MVENSGDIRICQQRCPVDSGDSVDRKLDLLVGELECYKIAVAGIQETKWFGTDVWPAIGGYTLLHSGRPIPSDDADGFVRREGVGILMNKRATAAWRAAGEEWKALVMVRLKWIRKRWRRSQELFVTIICVYAPTPSSVKSRFIKQLQDVLDGVPQHDVFCITG